MALHRLLEISLKLASDVTESIRYMKSHPELSVIIVTHSREEVLSTCLEHLAAQTCQNFEALIIETTPISSPQVQTLAQRYSWMQHYHIGTHKQDMQSGRNVGILLAQAPIVAFIDDDCFVRHDWVANLLDTFAGANSNIAAIGGRVVDRRWEDIKPRMAEPGEVGVVRPDGTIIRKFSSLTEGAIEVQHLPGGNSAVRKSIALQFGGFDPCYGGTSHREETDFYYRVYRGGYTLLFRSNIEVYHFAASKQGHGYNARGQLSIRYWEMRNHTTFIRNNINKPALWVLFQSLRELVWHTLAGIKQNIVTFGYQLVGLIHGLPRHTRGCQGIHDAQSLMTMLHIEAHKHSNSLHNE